MTNIFREQERIQNDQNNSEQQNQLACVQTRDYVDQTHLNYLQMTQVKPKKCKQDEKSWYLQHLCEAKEQDEEEISIWNEKGLKEIVPLAIMIIRLAALRLFKIASQESKEKLIQIDSQVRNQQLQNKSDENEYDEQISIWDERDLSQAGISAEFIDERGNQLEFYQLYRLRSVLYQPKYVSRINTIKEVNSLFLNVSKPANNILLDRLYYFFSDPRSRVEKFGNQINLDKEINKNRQKEQQIEDSEEEDEEEFSIWDEKNMKDSGVDTDLFIDARGKKLEFYQIYRLRSSFYQPQYVSRLDTIKAVQAISCHYNQEISINKMKQQQDYLDQYFDVQKKKNINAINSASQAAVCLFRNDDDNDDDEEEEFSIWNDDDLQNSGEYFSAQFQKGMKQQNKEVSSPLKRKQEFTNQKSQYVNKKVAKNQYNENKQKMKNGLRSSKKS
ncbi:hypothetical protein ABPG74_007426 [Tetrahymena malaccensis]